MAWSFIFERTDSASSPPSHLHQPARAFHRRNDGQSKQQRGNHADKEHPAPAGGGVPGFISHALDEHVDEYGGKDAEHDSQLIQRHQASAKTGGRDLGDVHGSNDRSRANSQAANQPPDHELGEAGGEPHPERRQSKAGGAKSEPFLQADAIDHRACAGGADGASDEGASRGPADAGGVKLET